MKHWENSDTKLDPALLTVDFGLGIQAANRMLNERAAEIDPDVRILFTIATASLSEVARLERRVAELEKNTVRLEKKLFGERWTSKQA